MMFNRFDVRAGLDMKQINRLAFICSDAAEKNMKKITIQARIGLIQKAYYALKHEIVSPTK